MSEAKKVVRPLPRPDIYLKTRPFWDAAKEHKLLLQVLQGYQPVSMVSAAGQYLFRNAES